MIKQVAVSLCVSVLLAGCATPSRTRTLATANFPQLGQLAQEYLERQEVCALLPGYWRDRSGDEGFIMLAEGDASQLEPFVAAGLVQVMDVAHDSAATRPERRRLRLTELGRASFVDSCLTNTNTYPREVRPGFRIGRRVVSTLAPQFQAWRVECVEHAFLPADYRLQIEGAWFEPSRFSTNFRTLGVDEVANVGRVEVPLFRVNETWQAGVIDYVHGGGIQCIRARTDYHRNHRFH